jgi:hypothetical protein
MMLLRIEESSAIKLQYFARRYVLRRSLLVSYLIQNQCLLGNFQKAVCGYHIVNNEPLKEAQWEEINSQVLSYSGYKIIKTASGSHSSGCDLKSSIGNFSNKTTKQTKTAISISSYRLSSVCNQKNTGCLETIIGEIEKRDSSFTHYSLLVRDELHKENKLEGKSKQLCYRWYLIPKYERSVRARAYTWKPMHAKRGAHNEQVGWETEPVDGCRMTITFSMSSQLWIHIPLTQLKKFLVGKVSVDKRGIRNYLDLYDMMESSMFH